MSIRIFSSTAWNEINELHIRRDGQWQPAELRRYDGTQWELLWPCHFTYTIEYALSDFVVTRGKSSPRQIDSACLVTGNSTNATSGSISDSLLFFPLERMAADMAGAQIVSARLRLSRLPKQANDGQDTAYVNVGSALSGVDPSRSDNTWNRSYDLLKSSATSFARGQTRDVSINVSGITNLLNGKADCLCLPTTSNYTYDVSGYALMDPTKTVLKVTYYI